MKTLKKRILSGAMAGVLAMSLAVPAFASSGGGTDTPTTPKNMATEFSGKYEAPNIEVIVPTTGTVVINPYGLGTTVSKSDNSKVTLTGQVMSAPLAVKNQTGMWLNVGATATAVFPADATMKLAATSTKGTPDKEETDPDYVAPASGKSAFVQLEVVQAPATVAGADANVGDLIIDASAVAANWANSGKLTVSAKGATADNLAVLKPADMTGTNGGFKAYKAGSVALFRLSGDCTSGPKATWDAKDTFTVNVVFNFVPAEAPTQTITYALTGATTPTTTSAKEGESVTITITGTSTKTYDSCVVTDASGGTVTATVYGAGTQTNAANTDNAIDVTFTMPAGGATVTAEFS